MKKPKEVVEVIGNLSNLEGKRAYLGFEPSGQLHEGHLIPIKALSWVASLGAKPILWVADTHAKLNGKEIHPWMNMLKYLPISTQILLESKHLDKQKWFDALLEISKKVNYKRCVRAIECAGRSEKDAIKMSSLVYSLLQAVDIHCLDVDVVVGGTDQRKVHMLARDIFKKLNWKVPTMVHTKLLVGKDGFKMSSSNPESCKFLEELK